MKVGHAELRALSAGLDSACDAFEAARPDAVSPADLAIGDAMVACRDSGEVALGMALFYLVVLAATIGDDGVLLLLKNVVDSLDDPTPAHNPRRN